MNKLLFLNILFGISVSITYSMQLDDTAQEHIKQLESAQIGSEDTIAAYYSPAEKRTRILIAYPDQTYARALICQNEKFQIINQRNAPEGSRIDTGIYNSTLHAYELQIERAGWIKLPLNQKN